MIARIAAGVLTCACLGAAATGAQPAPEPAGFIVDVKGRWEIARPGAATVRADRRAIVNGGDALQRRDEEPGSFVIVAMYTGAMEKYVASTTLPRRAATGAIARILRAIQQRFQEGFVTASVRGGGELPDAVVKGGGDHTDVSPVFTNLDPGTYSVTAYPVVDGKVSSAPRPGARVQAGPGAILIPALSVGLYELDVAGANPAAGGRAWIRVVAPERYVQAAGDFAQLAGTNAGGGPELHRATRALARTYLIILDETPAPAR